MLELAFVLTERAEYPDPVAYTRACADRGLAVTHDPGGGDSPLQFQVAAGPTVMVMLMPAPYPEASSVAVGPTSPPSDAAAACPAHFIVTVLEAPEDVTASDLLVATLAAALVDVAPAVGVMRGHGVVFHKAKLYADLARLGVEEGLLPTQLVAELTVARESEDRMSFLTHGLARYGREDLYVTCPIRGKGALDFIYAIARWQLTDRSKHFPTGDTIGRTADEKIVILREPSPTGDGSTVIRLDLPA